MTTTVSITNEQAPLTVRAAPAAPPAIPDGDSKTQATTKDGLIIIKRLSKHVQIVRRGQNEIFVRYVLPPDISWIAKKLITATEFSSRHPNVIMSLVAVKHRDHTVDVDTEFADAGSLGVMLPFFPEPERTAVAKSVARQVFASLFYFLVVHNKEHRNINPESVFLRRDGCVKCGFYDVINEDHVALNNEWFISSPYCAPECRSSYKARVNCDSRADVWAVGALIVAIMLGKTLLPKGCKRQLTAPTPVKEAVSLGGTLNSNAGGGGGGGKSSSSSSSPSAAAAAAAAAGPTETHVKQFRQELEMFEELVNASDDVWRDLIKDHGLRHLAKRCLRTKPDSRASLGEACALTMMLGGLQTPDGVQWTLEMQQQQLSAAASSPTDGSSSSSAAAAAAAAGGGSSSSRMPSMTTLGQQSTTTSGSLRQQQIPFSKLPDPFATDPTALEEIKNIVTASAKMRQVLLKPEVQPDKLVKAGEVFLEEEAAKALRDLAGWIHLELEEWKKTRQDEKKRSLIDKIFREIIKKREALAWKTMQRAVLDARINIQHLAASVAQQQQASSFPSSPVLPMRKQGVF